MKTMLIMGTKITSSNSTLYQKINVKRKFNRTTICVIVKNHRYVMKCIWN